MEGQQFKQIRQNLRLTGEPHFLVLSRRLAHGVQSCSSTQLPGSVSGLRQCVGKR
jgi:hypothetical protein